MSWTHAGGLREGRLDHCEANVIRIGQGPFVNQAGCAVSENVRVGKQRETAGGLVVDDGTGFQHEAVVERLPAGGESGCGGILQSGAHQGFTLGGARIADREPRFGLQSLVEIITVFNCR